MERSKSDPFMPGDVVVPGPKLLTQKSIFSKPYYIVDDELCVMDDEKRTWCACTPKDGWFVFYEKT